MALTQFTDANFAAEAGSGLVFVDFYADWCGPCQAMLPTVEQLAGEMAGVKFGKVNVDESSEIAAHFGVMSIPTFVVLKDGQEIKRLAGAMPKETLQAEIESAVAA